MFLTCFTCATDVKLGGGKEGRGYVSHASTTRPIGQALPSTWINQVSPILSTSAVPFFSLFMPPRFAVAFGPLYHDSITSLQELQFIACVELLGDFTTEQLPIRTCSGKFGRV